MEKTAVGLRFGIEFRRRFTPPSVSLSGDCHKVFAGQRFTGKRKAGSACFAYTP